MTATGLFLGLFDKDWAMEERTIAVAPHDRLLLVTDGVSEALSPTGTAFGTDSLHQLMRDTATLQESLRTLWKQLQEFTQHQLQDDVTCIAMRFQPLPRPQVLFLENDPSQVQPVVATLLQALAALASPQEREAIRISLGEILMNAIEHGNLAIGYAQKRLWLEAGTFDERVEIRRCVAPYASRRVRLEYVIEPLKFTATIADEGAGFDWQAIPDPRQATHVGLVHGRGLLIARTNMDTCSFHPPGNRVTLVKYFSLQTPYEGKRYASFICHKRP